MRASAIAFCLAVLLLAGCGGGGSKQLTAAEYRAKLAGLGKEADAAQAGFEQGLKAKSVHEVAVRLKAFAAAEDGLADKVGKLKPPDDAKAANEELAAGLHAIVDAVREALPRVEASTTRAGAVIVLEHSEAGASAGQQVDHALNALKKLGYTKGS
jgi:hypothetical protein